DAIVLRHDGTVAPLHLARSSPPSPGPRYSHAMVSVPVGDNEGHGNGCGDVGGGGNSSSGSSGGGRNLAFLFGGCHGDGTRAAPDEAFVLDLSGGAAAGGDGGCDGLADEEGGGQGASGGDSQDATTKVFDGGDVYTGQLDASGQRQGKGRCDYGVAVDAAGEGPAAVTVSGGGGGGSDGSYSGDWDADKPHGRGERLYAAPREGAKGGGSGGGGGGGNGGRGRGGERGGGAAADVDEDTAIVVAAFGPGCPPLASYRGDFKRGVRDGHGVCSFFTAGCGGGCSVATGGTPGATSIPTIPDSYDGEWVGGRPLGRGVLSLRAVAAAPAAPSNRFSSSVAGSGSGLAGRGGGSGGSIEGLWTEEGLAHGREKLPGKGGVYEGQYRLGKREGHGRLDLPDGSEYEGAWRNGRQNGIGTFRCGVTRHVYTGKWVGGVRCGRGVCEYASGSRYEGLWLDGLRHGEGVFYVPPGGAPGDGDPVAGIWHRD
ncbi:unnamed protein product, partial [Ectocarpus sp. 8 AP-2014]